MPHIKFKGKNLVVNHHLVVPYHTLVPRRDLSVIAKNQNVSLHDNLILHGDNLLALKSLLPTHSGKINCIYIDPLYNTGNENWCYNDNVKNPMMQEWLGKVVDKEDLTRHDKWLCMMYPRLNLLYELLAEDGVIFISIDDNEVHRLRMLMDEIFGEEYFIGNIIWKKTSGDNKTPFVFIHDNILVYAKNDKSISLQSLTATQLKQYSNPDNDPRGDWADSDYRSKWTKKERKNLFFAITNPNTGEKIYPDTFSDSPRVWGYILETHLKNEKNGLVWWGTNGKAREPKKKRFLSNSKGGNTRSIWLDAGTNDEAGKMFKTIFSENQNFKNPKPVSLIKKLINLATKPNDLILDSFAGSGTTAHAVMQLNEEDDGNRKFVLVECEEYANKITAERVRRVIKGVKNAKDDLLKKGLSGGFSYFELGEAVEIKSILEQKFLPSYEELARYVFFTATGEQWNEKGMKKKTNYIGESSHYEVYLLYTQEINKLKEIALTLDGAEKLPPSKSGKVRLVFAPVRYIKIDELDARKIKFCQLPFEIYRMVKSPPPKSKVE